MTIERIECGARMSQAVIHGDVVYLSGQICADGGAIREQTGSVLAKIDTLLNRSGSSRQKLLSVTIMLADIADFPEMNAVWDAWIEDVPAPARATFEANLALPELKVEISVIAARF